jgi:hypothetical protein
VRTEKPIKYPRGGDGTSPRAWKNAVIVEAQPTAQLSDSGRYDKRSLIIESDPNLSDGRFA